MKEEKKRKETNLNLVVINIKIFQRVILFKFNLFFKSNNKIINVVASIYASENGFDNCILLNKDKLVSEFINSNLFIIREGKIYTPTLKSGCLNGIVRKNLFKILSSSSFELYEQDLSTFDITQSDEIFGTNIAQGIFSVTKFRKKEYDCSQTKKIITMLNDSISLD